MQAAEKQFADTWEQIVAKAWSDADFKQRLLTDPASVFADYGIEIPEGGTVKVIENTDSVKTMVIPAPPPSSVTEVSADIGGCFPCWTF
jgi:hypothetical protein